MSRSADEERGGVFPAWIRIGTFLVILAVAGGAYLRFANIGRYGFWTDELFHVFAARSLLKDSSLAVPWNPVPYTRALPVTWITALSFRVFGESEASARAFFAAANIAFILTAALILRRLFSRTVAFLFAIAASLSTIGIQLSQECRMYTLFQFAYFLMSVAFIRGLERERSPGASEGSGLFHHIETRFEISLGPLAAAAGLGLVASQLQMLAANFIFVVFAYCIILFLYTAATSGIGASLRSKYAIVALLLPAAVFLFSLIRHDFVAGWLGVATHVPAWNRFTESNLHFYVRVLSESHAIESALYPVGVFLAIHRYGKIGLFFVLSFVVLFGMHCFVFGRVSERYIFHLLPFFLTVSAMGIEHLLTSGAASASRADRKLPAGRRILFTAALVLSAAFVVYPRILHTVLDTSVPKFSNWKDLDPELVRSIMHGKSMSTERWRFNYYFRQYPDYVLDSSDLERMGGERVVAELSDLKRVLTEYPDLYLVTYDQEFRHDAFVSPEIREYVTRNLHRVDREPDSRIMVFQGPGRDAVSAGEGG